MRALLVVGLLAGCTGDVEVRVCNRTGHAVTNVDALQLPPQDLAADECTPYMTAQHDVYRYTGARFSIGADEFRAQPVDFVGEDPLDAGKWSYELVIVDYAQRSVTVYAKED